MSVKSFFVGLPVLLALTFPAAAVAQPAVVPATHEDFSRAIDELAGQIHGLSERWRGHFAGSEPPGERPLLSIMLSRRQELGLSSAQVHELERLRADFQREAIKRDADQRVAEMDLAALLRADPVDMGKVEAKVREIERARVDLRVARIRAIEQGKAQLTADQRAKLASLLAQPWLPRPRTGQHQAPPPPAATARPLTQ